MELKIIGAAQIDDFIYDLKKKKLKLEQNIKHSETYCKSIIDKLELIQMYIDPKSKDVELILNDHDIMTILQIEEGIKHHVD